MDNLGRNSVELVDSDSLVAVGVRSSVDAGVGRLIALLMLRWELDSFVRLLLVVVGPVLALPLRNTLPKRFA